MLKFHFDMVLSSYGYYRHRHQVLGCGLAFSDVWTMRSYHTMMFSIEESSQLSLAQRMMGFAGLSPLPSTSTDLPAISDFRSLVT